MADQTNPFTMAGMMGMMQPNKYIDPAYRDQALPLPGFYTGQGSNVYQPPTDAMGNPIQSFTDASRAHAAWDTAHPAPAASATQGTTLNSTPQVSGLDGTWPANPSGAANPSWASSAQNPAMQARMNPGPGAYYSQGASNSLGGNQYDSARIPMTPFTQGSGVGSGQPGATAGGAAQTNPIDMRQAYLDALARPQGGGKIITPGATVPQAQPLGTPSVMDSFLSAHPGGGGAGAGNYNNTGFFDTLNKLRAS